MNSYSSKKESINPGPLNLQCKIAMVLGTWSACGHSFNVFCSIEVNILLYCNMVCSFCILKCLHSVSQSSRESGIDSMSNGISPLLASHSPPTRMIGRTGLLFHVTHQTLSLSETALWEVIPLY